MRRLLAVADVRDRAILLLLLDCGLRVSEAAGLRLGDLRPDGTLKVMGKGAKERIVPVGGTARAAIVRCATSASAAPGALDEPLFLGRRGALDWRVTQQVLERSKAEPGSPGDAARTRSATRSPGATSQRRCLFSLQRIMFTRRWTWSSATCAGRTRLLVARHRLASPADRLMGGRKR